MSLWWYISRRSDGRVLDCRPGSHDSEAPLKAVVLKYGGTTDDYAVLESDVKMDVWRDPAEVTAEKWAVARQERDQLLMVSDWKLLKWLEEKFNGEVPAALRSYRKALRDLPQTYSDPDQIVWPTEG